MMTAGVLALQRILVAFVLGLRWCVLCGLLLAANFLEASDKSGVSPNTISVPKGPGSIEGLGDSFQPTLNTGTAKYGIGLKVPPGAAGQHPEIHLTYEGGGGNGPLGYGWQLSQAGVQRQCDKGIPTYGESLGVDRVDRFLNDSKEELVPRGDGFFFCKNEGAFVRYQFVDEHWEATLPDGTRLFFGTSADSRIQDGTNAGKVFNWLLEREVDTRGNTIIYAYTNFPGAYDLNQRYLSEIRYGPGRPPWGNFHFVKFNYEARWDWFEDCRPGFVVRTGHRLHSVDVGTQGPLLEGHLQGDFNGDEVPDSLNRRYMLGYLEQGDSPNHGSLLQRITQIGADGLTALPPLTLGYSICAPPDRVSGAQSRVGSDQEPPVVMNSPFVDFVDLNGDGLPDILETRDDQVHNSYLNRGIGMVDDTSVVFWSKPQEIFAKSLDSLTQRLSAEDTHLADMDGDGRADLVHKIPDGKVIYFRNTGTNAWEERREMTADLDAPPAPFGAGNVTVRTGDFDFDKRTDIIRSDGLAYTIWFNQGNDRYSPRITIPQEQPFHFAIPTVQIADLNGDRVPDIARLGPSGLELTVGLGYGRFGPLASLSIPDLALSDDQLRRAKLSDITGDGLADLVLERADHGELWYWINLGNYTFTTRKVITGMPASLGLNTVTRWADMNGNGTTDLVYADPDALPKLSTFDLGGLLNCGNTPNLLTAISNGIGRVTLIGYAPSTQFLLQDRAQGITWTNGMPFPVTVISSITNLDSLGHSYVSHFRYHDGFYDPVEKQFRGFSRVEQIDIGDDTAPTEVTRSVIDTGRVFEAMKGRILQLSTETEDGRVFQTVSTDWTTPPKLLLTGTNGLEVRYAHPVGSTRRVLELGQGTERRLESEMQYDNYGNQIRHADYGIVENGERSAFDDERITVTEYAINTNAWILRAIKVQELRDENDVAISRSEHFYDDETFSGKNLGLVTIGNLTMKRDWISPSNSTATILSARTRYDTYGNPVALLDPLASAPGGVPDSGGGHWRSIDYDARFHAYPITETIELGASKDPLLFRAGYDEGFGTVTTSTDFNNNLTRYGYDTFSRLTRIIKPGDSEEFPTDEYYYALAVPVGQDGLVNYVETRQLDKAPAESGTHRDHYFINRAFVDGLGRKLMTRTEAEPAPGSQAPRVAVTEAVQFNARQKPARALNPYFTTLTGDLDTLLSYEPIEATTWKGEFHENGKSVLLDLAQAHASRTVYDAALRPVRVFNPDGTFRQTRYEPLVTFSYDENDVDPLSPFHDTPIVHYHDGLERLVRVDEKARLNDDGTPASDVRTWTTRYSYDLNDQLTRILDSQNNLKTFAYDGLKRKKRMEDPDRGSMVFAYDDASNLIESTDAKGQRISYTYDGANRIRTEKYHDGQAAPTWRFSGESLTNSIVYHYDSPFPNLPQGDNTLATARNVKGALAWVEDLSGEEHTSYDSRGRVEFVIKRIADPLFVSKVHSVNLSSPLVSYGTAFAYDSLDRLTNLTYPDADQVRYEYNDRNLIQRIPGGPSGDIIADIAYQPSAQMGQIDYGNGVRTTYAYDARLRLKNLLTVSQPATLNQQLINCGYDFDGVSNIKSIADLRPGSTVSEGDPRRNTQIFQYDDLYRLTRVQYSFALPANALRNDGEINYRYDRIGNMLAQTSTLDHKEKGVPVANLGDMDSGGAAGRWNRASRAAKNPPGPHALSAIRNPQFPRRDYPYDANGNMTNIDGLVCTWDFKDRLVAVENNEMRAAYSYDYTDRRIIKDVAYKPSSTNSTNHDARVTTQYINKYFEVREHDAPTKYVWNGNTRVARVTGSLTTYQRVQRLRLWPGWNLVSLAVSSPSPLWGEARGEVLSAAFRWNPATLGWDEVLPNDTLPACTVLWLQATTNATLTITGTYTHPTNRTVTASGDFMPSAGLEIWNLKSQISNSPTTTAWTYDAPFTRWLSWLPPPLELQSDLPAFLAPGQAVFARADAPTELDVPESAMRIRYYHQDHWSSTATVTDATGSLVWEMANFAFGLQRIEYSPQTLAIAEAYRYTQKETDRETSLAYFEARYVHSALARMCSVDQAVLETGSGLTRHPQRWNGYAYAENRPVTQLDPDGNWVALIAAVVFAVVTSTEYSVAPTGKEKTEDLKEWRAKPVSEEIIDTGVSLVPVAKIFKKWAPLASKVIQSTTKQMAKKPLNSARRTATKFAGSVVESLSKGSETPEQILSTVKKDIGKFFQRFQRKVEKTFADIAEEKLYEKTVETYVIDPLKQLSKPQTKNESARGNAELKPLQ